MEVPMLDEVFFPGEQVRDPGLAETSYYDLLEVQTTASKVVIREAFIRLKNTYTCKNSAFYSLLDDDASKQKLAQIEQAYHTLRDDILRSEYDQSLRQQNPSEGSYSDGLAQQASARHEADPFVAADIVVETPQGVESFIDLTMKTGDLDHGKVRDFKKEYPTIRRFAPQSQVPEIREKIEAYLADADLGNGGLFVHLRQIMELTREEVQERTKISPEYILAIENNEFHKLPAMVYVKGFLRCYLEYLGIVDQRQDIVNAFAENVDHWQTKKN